MELNYSSLRVLIYPGWRGHVRTDGKCQKPPALDCPLPISLRIVCVPVTAQHGERCRGNKNKVLPLKDLLAHWERLV